MDPFGFLTEGYDALGRPRSAWRNLPIDSHAEIGGTSSYAGKYPDYIAFEPVFVGSAEFASCMRATFQSYLSGYARTGLQARVASQLPESDVWAPLTTLYQQVGFRVRKSWGSATNGVMSNTALKRNTPFIDPLK